MDVDVDGTEEAKRQLRECLASVLREVDERGFKEAAIHIDMAIIALGGQGTPPPERS